MQKILFKYTSRSRPENFERGLISIIENANDLENISILVTLDSDDAKIEQYRELLKPYYSKCFIKVVEGTSKNKVDAINRDLNEFKGAWDILVNMSDDMIFTEKGFDTIIRNECDIDTFLHLPDGIQNDNVSTMSIMGRVYYERDMCIYNPRYASLWCDVEATEVGWIRGCLKYVSQFVFSHLHPAHGLAPTDEQYMKTEHPDVWNADKAVIFEHRAINYGLKEEEIKKPFKYTAL